MTRRALKPLDYWRAHYRGWTYSAMKAEYERLSSHPAISDEMMDRSFVLRHMIEAIHANVNRAMRGAQ